LIAGIVPVSPLSDAKTRLQAPGLSEERKRELVIAMLETVLEAMVGSRLDSTYVVTCDPRLLRLSARAGARPVREPGRLGADGAVSYATKRAVRDGAQASLVMLSDVPLVTPRDVDRMIDRARRVERCVVAARSNRGGTNALCRVPAEAIPTRYGENSFMNHRVEARKAGIPFFEFRCARIAFDVDTVKDLRLLAKMDRESKRYPFISEMLGPTKGREGRPWRDPE